MDRCAHDSNRVYFFSKYYDIFDIQCNKDYRGESGLVGDVGLSRGLLNIPSDLLARDVFN